MDDQQNVPQPKVEHMVGSLLLHGYPLTLTSTLSSTATIWCVFYVDCAALVTHTGVEFLNAFRSHAQPAAVTQFYCLSLHIGTHS